MHCNINQPVGIVAGWGNYPIAIARELKAANIPLVVAGIREHASHELKALADDFRWFGIGRLGGQQKWFARHGVRTITLAGKLFKDRILFHGFGWLQHLPDLECIKTFYPHFVSRRSDNRDDSMLSAIVASFERRSMTVVPGTDFAPHLLVEEGYLTRRRASPKVEHDMLFGWQIAKQMGGLDVGQSVTVRDRTILSVEAVEGTDACIDRTAQLCPRGGFSLVKVAKPHQDMRFDVPTIGLQTIERLYRAGGSAIAIEAGYTIFVDRQDVIRKANRYGISIVAWTDQSVSARVEATSSASMTVPNP